MKMNIAHSEFPDQQGGLMICGYEWGGGDESGDAEGHPIDWEATCTFVNKELRYGPQIMSEPYDNRIKKWFAMWGQPLNRENPGQFEKSIIQTNWCDTQNPQMNNDYTPLWNPAQVKNFIDHVAHFSPSLILFMGSRLIEALQNPSTLEQFEAFAGKCTKPLSVLQKPSDHRRFKISFQTFERCDVVCFPHPSATRGLSDNYIALFNEEMTERLAHYESGRRGALIMPG